MESNYSIQPDQVQPNKFRVAWAGSGYTVSFKKVSQHGLTKAQAEKVKAMLDERRESAINRLADLVDEWYEINPAPNMTEEVKRNLSAKYRIGIKTISATLLMNAGGINSEVKR